LEENDLKDYVEMVVPDPNDAQELSTHKKKEVKVGGVGFYEGSPDSSYFREEDNNRYIRCFGGLVPKQECKLKVYFET
jgi:hypothetical protein